MEKSTTAMFIGHRECFGLDEKRVQAAIPARNRFLVNHSAYALCYVDHDWGGAAKTYRLAVRQGLQVINLGELDHL